MRCIAALRSENLDELRALNLRPEDLELRGWHPALGVVTLSELLAKPHPISRYN